MNDSPPNPCSGTSSDLADEMHAQEAVTRLAAELAAVVGPVWRWGDGAGGWVHLVLDEAFEAAGLPGLPVDDVPTHQKAPIPPELRWEVWERDDFTCLDCGTRRDLTVDHVHPESRGGPTTLDNLATRCRPCNSRKGVQ